MITETGGKKMAVKPPDIESLTDAQIRGIMWLTLKARIVMLGTQGIIKLSLAKEMLDALELFKPPKLFADARR